MIVSFLIPTRQRLQALLDGIQSIKEKASPDVQLEFLVRIDEDDYDTLTYRHRIPTDVQVNFGYAFSPKTMYWKHMTALAFSQKIGDSVPNEDWYEEKWIKWDYERNNENLEVSKGYEHLIPLAEKYDTSQLPETIIKEFIDRGIFKL